jgi:undecaprenyl pyrophosphate phosphatase UppP
MMQHAAQVTATAVTAAAKATCGGTTGVPCYHINYVEAVVTGLIQGVTELFPVSSLGHNVLLPALIGGSWANDLNVSAPGSPYLAFIVGLHVATAIAMIAFFWRDWLRIIRGFVSSVRTRSVTTPDERLAWMIILGTIPVGIVGLALQKTVTNDLAHGKDAAVFLAINGVILLVSERMRRARAGRGAGGTAVPTVVLPAGRGVPSGPVPGAPGVPGAPSAPGRPSWGPGEPAGPGRPVRPGPEGYSQQPWQQQWQGPGPRDPRDPRYGQGGNPQYPGNGQGWHPQQGQPQPGQPQPGQPQFRPNPQGGQPGYGQPQPNYGQPPYGRDPRGEQPQYDPWARDPRDPRGPQAGDQRPAGGRHGRPSGHADGHRAPADGGVTADPAVAADRRLSTAGYKRAILIGAAQILALLPGISRDGIVTVAGMSRGLSRQDAVRFSFLLSAPVILAAGVLKLPSLAGSASAGMHGPIIVGSVLSGVGAYLSIRFLTKYFSEEKSLNPFGIYCLVAGILSFAYLVVK